MTLASAVSVPARMSKGAVASQAWSTRIIAAHRAVAARIGRQPTEASTRSENRCRVVQSRCGCSGLTHWEESSEQPLSSNGWRPTLVTPQAVARARMLRLYPATAPAQPAGEPHAAIGAPCLGSDHDSKPRLTLKLPVGAFAPGRRP